MDILKQLKAVEGAVGYPKKEGNLRDGEGRHTLKVVKVTRRSDEEEEAGKKNYWSVDFEVVDSDTLSPGSPAYINYSVLGVEKWQIENFYKGMMEFVAAVVGEDPNDVTAEVVEAAFHEDQPLENDEVVCIAKYKTKVSKKTGKEVTFLDVIFKPAE